MQIKNKSISNTAYVKPPTIKGSAFSKEEIEDVRESGRILSITIMMGNSCNLRCSYCYRDAGENKKTCYSINEWENVLKQAKIMGVQTVWIPGSGEPMLDPAFCKDDTFPLIELCESLGLWVTFFTNGTQLTKKRCEILSHHKVSIITKLNSFNHSVQDCLAGKSGIASDIYQGLELLLSAGFTNEIPTRLGIDSVIVPDNYDEMEKLFSYCRDRNIIPYITANLHAGRSCENPQLDVSLDNLQLLFEKLLEIDQRDYGHTWFPSPPIVASHCQRLLYDVVVESGGNVTVCPGLSHVLGNIEEKNLDNILQSSELFKKIRNMPETLQGKCRSCKSKECVYGCRLEAFHAGNLFGEDPFCWH